MDYGNDTIAALGTGHGVAALAVLRVNGPGAMATVQGLLKPGSDLASWADGAQRFVHLYDGETVLDEAMVSVHRAPRSYTGEDSVEVSCHGSPLLAGSILAKLYALGARPAEPGEFTRRAFLNGKMELTRAEAVMDLINAHSMLALRAATEQLEGRLGAAIQEMLDRLLTVVAHVEAHIDFPDEDIDPGTVEEIAAGIEQIRAGAQRLLGTEFQGRVFREGLRVVIAGAPNAGKSSLLNRLLGFDRAIVSSIPGTTRDFIEETLSIRGVPVRLVDTAGLREAADELEAAGIERAQRAIGSADVALLVVDGAVPRHTDEDLIERVQDARRLLRVVNKTDLGVHESWRGDAEALRVSCLTGEGLDALADKIAEVVLGRGVAPETLVAVNARHADALRRAAQALEAARMALLGGVEPEFVAVDLRVALAAYGEILGRVDPEDILGKIFATFCIGK